MYKSNRNLKKICKGKDTRASEGWTSKARGKISPTSGGEAEENSWALTTSIICMSVRPKLSTRGSDSLPTGRSSTLYVSSRSFSSFFSWRPPLTSPVPNHNQQSMRSLYAISCDDLPSPRRRRRIDSLRGKCKKWERDNAGMAISFFLAFSSFLSFSLSLSLFLSLSFCRCPSNVYLRRTARVQTYSIYLPIPSLL